MCHVVRHQLICMHTWTEYLYCRRSRRNQVCRDATYQDESYPPRHNWNNLPAQCPMGNACPFEAKGRCWECCWCHKMGNRTGQCSALMTDEGQSWRCGHVCCQNCTTTGH